MTLSGALSDPEDQATLALGIVEIIDGCVDKSGRPAVIVDSGRVSCHEVNTDSVIRSIFYVAHAALEGHIVFICVCL